MDNLDKRILWELQSDFPICERPYEVVAERLGVGADEVWERVIELFESGMIRRIGASFDSRKLGFSSTLAAVRVDKDSVEEAAKVIGDYREVTHSYLRRDEFNIWFTLAAESEGRIKEILGEICEKLCLGDEDMLNLPAKRMFKLDTRFNLLKEGE